MMGQNLLQMGLMNVAIVLGDQASHYGCTIFYQPS